VKRRNKDYGVCVKIIIGGMGYGVCEKIKIRG